MATTNPASKRSKPPETPSDYTALTDERTEMKAYVEEERPCWLFLDAGKEDELS